MLTLDLGNSTLDVMRWPAHVLDGGAGLLPEVLLGDRMDRGGERREAPGERWRLPADDALFARLAGWLVGRRPGRAALSSVNSAGRTGLVVAALEAAGWETLSPPDPGLEIACETPWTVGQDRLFAARAAFALVPEGALVVDAGTALTVDAVLADERGRGVFRGGAIAPGPELLARALASGGARLPRIEPVPGAPALGTDTAGALAAGVVVGFRGAARALVEGLEAELGRSLAVFVTGGARSFLLEPQPFVDRELRVAPDLVHRGLVLAALT